MFTELSLHERLLKALSELSFTKPTPVQAAAIPHAIAGEDLYIIAQTGRRQYGCDPPACVRGGCQHCYPLSHAIPAALVTTS